jgi:hypothetical protein
VSARNLINAALGIASQALAIEIPAADDEPGVARIEGLLHALVTAQLATAEAVLEGQRSLALTLREEDARAVIAEAYETGWADHVEPMAHQGASTTHRLTRRLMRAATIPD